MARRDARGVGKVAQLRVDTGSADPAGNAAIARTCSRNSRRGAHPAPAQRLSSTCPASPACMLTVTTVALGKKLNSEALAQV